MKIRAKKVTTLTDYHFKDGRPNSFPVKEKSIKMAKNGSVN